MRSNYITLALALLFAMCLAIDARVNLGLKFLYAELVVLALLISVLARGRVQKIQAFLPISFLFLLLFSSATIFFTDDQRATFSSVRNLTSTLIALTAFSLTGFDAKLKFTVLKYFVLVGIIVSLLGIHQAIFGLDKSITVYSMGMADYAESRTSFALNWKLKNLIDSGIFTFQSSLAIGLHQYSNNFAEFLIYIQISVLALRASRSISGVYFAFIYAVLIFALVLSQSRTCQIGFVAISIIHIISITRGLYLKVFYIFATAVSVLLFLPFLFDAFGYDGMMTVRGRQNLNYASILAIGDSIWSMVFGGNVRSYYENNLQDPHNMFLYLALHFGIIFAILAGLFFVYLAYRMWQPLSTETPDERILRRCGLLASCWLVGYGFTWSVISVGAAGMTWAMLVGMALPRQPGNMQPRNPPVSTTPFSEV